MAERIEPSAAGTPDSVEPGESSDRFYVDLFVNDPYWSGPEPNLDEKARWCKIGSFLEQVVSDARRVAPDRILRLLDVGCGRGWLTNLATAYGRCEGIEPVAGVVEHARRLFPHLRFAVDTAESARERPGFRPFDVVLCSEVLEHVPHPEKPAFVAHLARLLAEDGHLILTTPRAEVWEEWSRVAPPNQPVEEWVTEEQLRALLTDGGFQLLGVERIHIEIPSLRFLPAATVAEIRSLDLLAIYQVWACRRASDRAAPSVAIASGS